MHRGSQGVFLDPSDEFILCRRQVLCALDSLDVVNHQHYVPGSTVSSFLPKGANVVNAQSKEFDIEDQVQRLANTKVLEHERETVWTGKMQWVVLALVSLLVIMWRWFVAL